MKYLKILYVQVIIGIIAGVCVGWLFPAFHTTAKLISDTYKHDTDGDSAGDLFY